MFFLGTRSFLLNHINHFLQVEFCFYPFMSLFVSSYSNILNLDSSVLTFHAYSMIFVIFIQFFLGFLFVVFPRFLVQAEIQSKVYMNQFYYIFLIF